VSGKEQQVVEPGFAWKITGTGCALAMTLPCALAQNAPFGSLPTYPVKSIRLILPAGPGGGRCSAE
jgi:hypothetical protein